jgi:hypothetical protein
MNRKQRVLTIWALIAFVVIGACHYLRWPPLVLYETKWVSYTLWEERTYEEARLKEPDNKFLDLIFIGNLEKQGGYTDAKGEWQTYRKDDLYASHGAIPVDAKLWFPIQTGTAKSIGTHISEAPIHAPR